MKINKLSFLMFVMISFSVFSQQPADWKKMSNEEKATSVKKMTTSQKMSLLQNFKEDLLVDELEIPENKQQEFSALYTEYQRSQKNIKGNFQKREDFGSLTDGEAQKELDASFEVGQQLLDNKKDFSRKFQTVIKPQQVLQLFENEGKMRTKVRERNRELQQQNSAPAFQQNERKIEKRNTESAGRRSSTSGR